MVDAQPLPEVTAEDQAFEELFAKGQAYFEGFVRELRSYGIEPDPDMTVELAKGMNNYYDLKDGNIYLALPSLSGGLRKFYLLFLKNMLSTDSNDAVLELFELLLPRIVAHELGHSLRHRYGRFRKHNLWDEEQIANQLAMALVKRSMSPEKKARVREVLAWAIAEMGKGIDAKDIGLDSYRDVLHALQVTQQLDHDTVANIELVQSLFAVGTDELLLASGQLEPDVLQRIEQRQEVIDELNEQYTKDAARYAYSHFSWMYYDFLSGQSDYVDEFRVMHLGLGDGLLPEIGAEGLSEPSEIQALFRAAESLRERAGPGARYFHKRYRTALLKRLEATQLNVPGGRAGTHLRGLMEIWNEDRSDPIDLLELVSPPDLKPLFPTFLARNAGAQPLQPDELPTETDRRLWRHLGAGGQDEDAAHTVERLAILDRIPMLRPLAAELQLSLAHRMYALRLDSGAPVLWRGERNSDIFILVDGLLEAVVEREDDGPPQRVGVIEPGSLFGEYSFIANERANATVRAVKPSQCYVFKGNDLRPLTYQHPAALAQIAASVAQKLSHANLALASRQPGAGP